MPAPTPSTAAPTRASASAATLAAPPVIRRSDSSGSIDLDPGQLLLYATNRTDSPLRSGAGSLSSTSLASSADATSTGSELDPAGRARTTSDASDRLPRSYLRPPPPSPTTAGHLRQVMNLVRNPARHGDRVLVMEQHGLALAGSPGSDATVTLRREHALPIAPTASAAAAAVRALMHRTGHVPPRGPVVTLDAVCTSLQSIAPRDHEAHVDAQTLQRTSANIHEDITRWEARQASTADSGEQMLKDFRRCDYSVDGIALSIPGARTDVDAFQRILDRQPLDVQRFIHSAAHQGSLADAYAALVRSLHEDEAVLSSAGVPAGEQVSTQFHIALADPQRPSVTVQHTRRISHAGAMVGVDGTMLDLDRAPPTTADSGFTLALVLTLDRASGQIEATGTQQLRITYPTDRALHLDRILTASQQDAPEGDHMLDGLRDYARTLAAALLANASRPQPGAATADAIHDFHRRAMTELAGYRGERVPIMAARLADYMQALDGLLIDGPAALLQLQADHRLTPEQMDHVGAVLTDASLHACASTLERSALSIVNSGVIGDARQPLPVRTAPTLDAAHPVIQRWLRAAGIPLHPADPPFEITGPRAGLARHLSLTDDPVARDAALARLSIASADLILAMTDGGLAGIADELLAVQDRASGKARVEDILHDAAQLQRHGIQTLLPADLPRFCFDLLARHVAGNNDTAVARTVLETLLRTRIPAPSGTSLQAYLACCHLLAATLHDRSGDTAVLRPHAEKDTLHKRVADWVQSGIRAHGPLPEMSALLPRRTLLRSWSTTHVRMPPPLRQQTGDGSASVATVVEHLRTLQGCINQILDHTRPPVDAPRAVMAGDPAPSPHGTTPGDTMPNVSGARDSGAVVHAAADAADATRLTRQLDTLLSSRHRSPTLLRLADVAATLKAAMALPDAQLIQLLLRPSVTSRLVALAAAEALTPCAGSSGRDAGTFCTLVATSLSHALDVTTRFKSDTLTRHIQAAFSGDGSAHADERADARGSRSAPALLLEARGTDAARELASLLYIHLPAHLLGRGAAAPLLALPLRTRQGPTTLGDALRRPPRVGTWPPPSAVDTASSDPATAVSRVAALADAIDARLPEQLAKAIAERDRVHAADARVQAARQQDQRTRRQLEAEAGGHLQRHALGETAAHARRLAGYAAEAEWRAARHRESLHARLDAHTHGRARADAISRATQLILYRTATLEQQVRKLHERDERVRLYGPATAQPVPEHDNRAHLSRTSSTDSLASLASMASHGSTHTVGSASTSSGTVAQDAAMLSSEGALTAWLETHAVPDDAPGAGAPGADALEDAPQHRLLDVSAEATVVREAQRTALRSDVPAAMLLGPQASRLQSIDPDLTRVTRTPMTPEDDAATTAALERQTRAVEMRRVAQRQADAARRAQVADEERAQRRADARRGTTWYPTASHPGLEALATRMRHSTPTAYLPQTEQEIVRAMAPLGLTAEQQEPRLAAYSRRAEALQHWHQAPPRPEPELLSTLATLAPFPHDLPPPGSPHAEATTAPAGTAADDALATRLAGLRRDWSPRKAHP